MVPTEPPMNEQQGPPYYHPAPPPMGYPPPPGNYNPYAQQYQMPYPPQQQQHQYNPYQAKEGTRARTQDGWFCADRFCFPLGIPSY